MKNKTIILTVILSIIFSIFCPVLITYAEESTEERIINFDSSPVTEDLKETDLSAYPRNALGESDIISFVEYCYSDDENYSGHFGLYIYVYNPTCTDIVKADEYNSVNMLVGFNEDGSSIYDNVNLKYLSKSEDNKFYKFKISDSNIDLYTYAQEYSKNNEGKRLYEIIALQLRRGTETESVNVSKKYEWSGHAVGYALDGSPISTLKCEDFGTRSIHLEINQTNYRFADKGNFLQDELNSVYFSIPEEYFREFGNLNKIKAEWYEYKTDYMFVTSNPEAYSALMDVRNIPVSEYGYACNEEDKITVVNPDTNEIKYIPNISWSVFWEEAIWPGTFDYGFYRAYNPLYAYKLLANNMLSQVDFLTNYYLGYPWEENKVNYINQSVIDWLFYVSEINGVDGYYVTKEEVQDYMKRYTNLFYDHDRIRSKYSSELFVESIDEDRINFLEDQSQKSGHVVMEFTAGEDFDSSVGNVFIDSDKTQSFWNNFWFGTKYVPVNFSPIETIKEGDLVFDADAFSEKYYVNKRDAAKIIEYAKEAYENNERPVLLRFAVTDYYASSARFDYYDNKDHDMEDHNGYVAQETCFLDFDVISIEFKDLDGYDTAVFGVVAEPIDIINGLTPPDDLIEEDPFAKLWSILLFIVVVVVLIFLWPVISIFLKVVFDLIWFVLKAVLNLLFKILTLPFRLFSRK